MHSELSEQTPHLPAFLPWPHIALLVTKGAECLLIEHCQRGDIGNDSMVTENSDRARSDSSRKSAGNVSGREGFDCRPRQHGGYYREHWLGVEVQQIPEMTQ